MKPERVTIRSYQVGFGDCFLLGVHYDSGDSKYVLIDFGSTGLPEGTPSTQMTAIARNIAEVTGGKLTAVVATHRHKDHISGFSTNKKGNASGNIIAGLEPDLVLQPWTEAPDIAEDAVAPKAGGGQGLRAAAARQVRTLGAMQEVAGHIWTEAKRNRSLQPELRSMLRFMGENNVKNLDAIRNLMTMGKASEYLSFGRKTKLSGKLGVEVHVLGPPTVRQHEEIKSERSWDADEFWVRLAEAGEAEATAGAASEPVFPRHVVKRNEYRFPVDARWLIYRAKHLRGEQLLRIVTMLDDALNNTSLILLFRIGTKSFLFPGDAQIENWEYALAQEDVRKLLRGVDVYKVGHHGSRNATPKTLWSLFDHRSHDDHDHGRLTTMMSTMAGKHGSEANKSEVPRRTLVTELRGESTHLTTQKLGKNELFLEAEFDVT